MPKKIKPILVCAILSSILGCTSIGPRRVDIDRGVYNNVVRETEMEQILLNIVRLRYQEITQYIQVSSLTASYTLTQAIGSNATATTPGSLGAFTVWDSSLTPSVSYSDTPTISYVPLSNVEFAKSLMTPVSMGNFLLLLRAGGYDISALLNLFIEKIGPHSADVLNYRGTDLITKDFLIFNKIIKKISILYAHDGFDVPIPVVYEKSPGMMLRFKPGKSQLPEALKLKKLLGVASSTKEIVFLEYSTLNVLEEKDNRLQLHSELEPLHAKNIVPIKIRSMYAILDRMGRGILIPQKDIEKHLTRELRLQDGTVFDSRKLMKNLFVVYCSDREPGKKALVKVKAHGHWFYINSSDQISKMTFAAVMRAWTLTSATAGINNSTPLLTIPVASAPK